MTQTRQFPRVGSVVLKARVLGGASPFETYITSLSEGGAFLVTVQSFPRGTTLHLDIRLPFQLGTIEARAETLYVVDEAASSEDVPAGVGLRFTELSEPARDRLKRYVRRFRELAARLSDESSTPALEERAGSSCDD